jgi:hypothetical protein
MKDVMPALISVRKNARVMITRNLDVQGGIVNGTCGILRSVHQKVLMIEHHVTHEIIPVTKVKQRISLRGTGRFVYRLQFPIILSWACTVHLVQGTTLDSVLINLDKTFFAPGQAYVALSRVTSFDFLHLMSFDPSSIIVNPKVIELMQYARLNGKLKSLVPEHDNNCNTEIHVSPSPIVKNQKTDDIKIMEGNDVFVKDLADEGFSLIIGNCRNIFKKFLPLNMFLLSSNFPKIASVVQKLSPAFTEINNTIQSSESFFESSNHTLVIIVLSKLHPSFSQ